ncbi:MAG TPA: hypothetical protein VF761_16730 [Gemmatimonadaceae bacterium]
MSSAAKAFQRRILEHVEEVEYVKEHARRVAETVIARVDVRELAQNSAGVVERIIATLLAELGPASRRLATLSATYAVFLGLPKLTAAQVRQLAEEASTKFFAFASPAMTDAGLQVSSRINDMVAAGVDPAGVNAALSSREGPRALMVPLAAVTKRVSASWMQFVDRDINDAAVSLAVDPPKTRARDRVFGEKIFSFVVDARPFTWIAVMDGHTCDGEFPFACAPRHGQRRTLIEWRYHGLPGSPVLVCSMHAPRGASPCRCVLASPKDLEAIEALEAIDAADAIKRGKARARR